MAGLTVTLGEITPPAFALQLKVAAPLAESTTFCPEHIDALFTVTVGEGDTSIVATSVAVQAPLAPVNVNVCEPLGRVPLKVVPVEPPGIQV